MRNNGFKIGLVALITLAGLIFMFFPSKEAVHEDLHYQDKEYILYFYQPNCSYCQLIADDVNDFQENGKIPLYKKDMYTDYSDKWDAWEIEGTPTMIYVKNGKVYDQVVGPKDCRKLMERFD
jgi:thiol-disulfide isomerase/thioredoxin